MAWAPWMMKIMEEEEGGENLFPKGRGFGCVYEGEREGDDINKWRKSLEDSRLLPHFDLNFQNF